jgi:arylsulfatase A-like enzyme
VLTGKYSHRNGFLHNGNRFDGSQPTVAKMLQGAGYQTALFGKWHLGSDPQGFDTWEILPGQGDYYNPVLIRDGVRSKREGYVTDLITEGTVEWLRGRDRDRPFLLMMQHKAPHRNWQPALRHLGHDGDRRYPEPDTLFDDYRGRGRAEREQDMTIDKTLTEADLKLVAPGRLTAAQREVWDAYYEPRNAVMRGAGLKGEEWIRWKYNRYMHDYLGCLKAVDESVGVLLNVLEEEGLTENTLVMYTSDQGFYLGEHGWFDKRWIYEESVRSPLLVRWPGVVAARSVNRDLVSPLDFAETWLDAAGLEVPEDMQGASLVPVLRGRTPGDWRKSFYYHYYEYPGPHDVRRHYGVITERYKLVHFYEPEMDYWELFDRLEDPRELRDAYADPAYARVRADLTREVRRLREELGVEREAQSGKR